jgi:chemotaxis protein MotB
MAIRRSRAEELENKLNQGALWAVTYGDLMSYLMILFLILFSFGVSRKPAAGGQKSESKYQETLVNIQKVFGGKGSSVDYERAIKREKEESMVAQLKEAMDKSSLSQYAKVETWDKKIHVVLADAVMFDSGKAELKPGSRALLKEVAAQLKPLPNPLVIEGHTDSIPIRGGHFGSNWELSMARAYAVLKFFQEQGIDPKRLAGIGYGENHPAADNSTPEGRAKNRRIEIDMIRTE